MNTLEKVKRLKALEVEVYSLNNEIYEDQKKCSHSYSDKVRFDTRYFYSNCLKCHWLKQVVHSVDIDTTESYNKNKDLLKEKWKELIK